MKSATLLLITMAFMITARAAETNIQAVTPSKSLTNQPPDVSTTDSGKQTSSGGEMLQAVGEGDIQAVKTLLRKGANPNYKLMSQTPIWLADRGNYLGQQTSNHIAIVELLVESALGEVVNRPTVFEIRSAVSNTVVAAMPSMRSAAVRLFEIRPDTTYCGAVLVRCDASAFDNVAMYETARASGKMMEEPHTNMATHVALSSSELKAFRLKRNSGEKWEAATFERASDAIMTQVKAISRENGNPHVVIRKVPAWAWALLTGDDDVSAQLIASPSFDLSKADTFTTPPLFQAAMNGCGKSLSLLLAMGADADGVNARDGSDSTALFAAAQNGHSNIVSVLLAKGANVDKCNKRGNSPLFMASLHGFSVIVDMLLKRGADIRAVDHEGRTPLHGAAWTGCENAAAALLRANTGVDPTDNNGWTPLHYAAADGHLAVAKVLIAAGANPSKQTKSGYSPVQLARTNGYAGVEKYLASISPGESKSESSDKSLSQSVGAFRFFVPDGWNPLSGSDLIQTRREFASGMKLDQYNRADSDPAKLDEFVIFQKPSDAQMIVWTIRIPEQTNFLAKILDTERKTLAARRGQVTSGNCEMVSIGGCEVVRVTVTLANSSETTNFHYWSPDRPGQVTTLMVGTRPVHQPQTGEDVRKILNSIAVKNVPKSK